MKQSIISTIALPLWKLSGLSNLEIYLTHCRVCLTICLTIIPPRVVKPPFLPPVSLEVQQIGTEGAIGLGESRWAAQPGLSALSANRRGETRDIISDATCTRPNGSFFWWGKLCCCEAAPLGCKVIKVEDVRALPACHSHVMQHGCCLPVREFC